MKQKTWPPWATRAEVEREVVAEYRELGRQRLWSGGKPKPGCPTAERDPHLTF